MYFKERRPPPEERDKAPEEMTAYRKFDSTYHPGLTEDDFSHELYDKSIKDHVKTGKEYVAQKRVITHPDYELLCRNCGWNECHERFSGYTSRVKVYHTRMNIGLWNIGSNWMLRDEPNDCTLANNSDAMEFLNSQNTTIPVPKIHRLSSRTDTFQLTLMSRPPGDTLYNVWHTYTKEEQLSIAEQLRGYIRQWRQLTAPRAQKVNGERLHDIMIGICRGIRAPSCKRIGYTTEDWLEDLTPELRKGIEIDNPNLAQQPEKIDQLLQELKDNFPKGGPYVFTHGDLNLTNIIVSEGKITGIVDWERGGFYPWWAERAFAGQVEDDRFDDILEVIDEELRPGYDKETFREKFLIPIQKVADAWESCPRFHRVNANTWFRRPFCECKAFNSRIREIDMGVAPTHEIADADPKLTQEDVDEFFGVANKIKIDEIGN